MKLRSFGKLFSLIAVLVIACALTCAVAFAEDAETYDVKNASNRIVVTADGLANGECGRIKLSWNEIDGAVKYAVYCEDEHIANSLSTYYFFNSGTYPINSIVNVVSPKAYTFKVMALDANNEILTSNSIVVAPQHDYYKSETTEPNCTENGYHIYTCRDCGTSYKTKWADMWGHKMGELIPKKEASCVTDGWHDHYICEYCELHFVLFIAIDGSETLIQKDSRIPAWGHNFSEYIYSKDPTCTENRKDFCICKNSGCFERIYKDVPGTALGHEYDNYVYNKDATCLTDGTETGKCIRCDSTNTRTAVGTALGHKFDDYRYNNDATCTADGTETSACTHSNCDDPSASDTRVAVGTARGHEAGVPSIENVVDPDCVNPGSYDEVYYCIRCNIELSRENKTTDPLGHTPSQIFVRNENAPSCTDPGSYEEYTYCTVCEEELTSEVKDVDALGHSFTIYVSDGNATCLEDGTKTASCNNGCGLCDTKTDVGSALGHTFSNYESDGNATCLEDGTKTSKCDRCDVTDTTADEGSALGHDVVLEENPEAFILYKYCSRCGEGKEFGKLQIPARYLPYVIKGAVVTVCLIIIICCIVALTRPATTTPWWKRGRY